MPFMLHGVLGGPKKKVKKVVSAKIQRPTRVESEEVEVVIVEMDSEASVAPAEEVPMPIEVVIVKSTEEDVEAFEIDPILEEDKNFNLYQELNSLHKKQKKNKKS